MLIALFVRLNHIIAFKYLIIGRYTQQKYKLKVNSKKVLIPMSKGPNF